MVHKQHEMIFRAGSRTYYNSSRFFPKEIRDDVTILYGFVRVADNFVDSLPQNREGFEQFSCLYEQASAKGKPSGDTIIDSFADLERRKHFDPQWTKAFLHSMELDLHKKDYNTLEETLEYIFGSAEVIGLFMASIMDLPKESYHNAALLGRAMQYINFIRDIDEDNSLGRRYLPLGDSGLADLKQETAEKHPDAFRRFIKEEIRRYEIWQEEAELGYVLIPRRLRIPIKTAGDMYRWTAKKIASDPMKIFAQKVKPPKSRILLGGIYNMLGGAG